MAAARVDKDTLHGILGGCCSRISSSAACPIALQTALLRQASDQAGVCSEAPGSSVAVLTGPLTGCIALLTMTVPSALTNPFS